LRQLCAALGVQYRAPGVAVKSDTNDRYLQRFRHSRVAPVHPRVLVLRARFERRLRRLGYGYSLGDRPSAPSR
jgi:hypothetical protein